MQTSKCVTALNHTNIIEIMSHVNNELVVLLVGKIA